jgi:hypothetical protein
LGASEEQASEAASAALGGPNLSRGAYAGYDTGRNETSLDSIIDPR